MRILPTNRLAGILVAVRAVLDAYFDGINSERYDEVAALFAPDGELSAPGVRTRRGPEEIAAYFRMVLARYPVHHDQPTRTVIAGSTATVEISFTGELESGAPITFEAVDVFDFDEQGKISKLVTWYDSHLVRSKLAAAQRMLTTEVRDGIAWVKLDRPDKLNAMPRSFYGELVQTAAKLARDDAVKVVVVHGAGRCFSVGGDIEDFGRIPDGIAAKRAYMREALAGFRAFDELPKPVVAAVHGHALGGGCELTMVCDIVVADETARFGTPEAGVGLVPGPGMVRGLSHVNLHWMKYMVLTGLPLNAEEARLAGLVNTVVPEGQHLAEAERLARAIASRSPLAVSVGKGILSTGAWESQEQVAESIALLQAGEDFAEGIEAFKQRRTPEF